jgi:hypothetical protein
MSDMGATESGRWHDKQLRCRIGATSFVKVTSSFAVLAAGEPRAASARRRAVRAPVRVEDLAPTLLPVIVMRRS